jgi:transposase-like protein
LATSAARRRPGGLGNARNGAYDKTVTTEIGEVDLRIPRDRQGTFEPTVVPKFQRRLDGLAGNVISLYAKGWKPPAFVDRWWLGDQAAFWSCCLSLISGLSVGAE